MKTILVTDTQTPLGSRLARQFIQEGRNVVAAPSDRPKGKTRQHPQDEFKKKNAVSVSWNRPSPLSCKNVLLQGLQKFTSLEAALVLVPPLPDPASFMDLKYLDIETVLDVWLKGSILMARDLLSHFISHRQGGLAFVCLFLPQ